MIQLHLLDGTAVRPEDALIRLRVGDDEHGRDYTWKDVSRIILIDGEYAVSRGTLGGPDGMPIRGLVWMDTSDLRVEIPMPLEAADALGAELQGGSKIDVVRSVPSGLVVGQKKPLWTPPSR